MAGTKPHAENRCGHQGGKGGPFISLWMVQTLKPPCPWMVEDVILPIHDDSVTLGHFLAHFWETWILPVSLPPSPKVGRSWGPLVTSGLDRGAGQSSVLRASAEMLLIHRPIRWRRRRAPGQQHHSGHFVSPSSSQPRAPSHLLAHPQLSGWFRGHSTMAGAAELGLQYQFYDLSAV